MPARILEARTSRSADVRRRSFTTILFVAALGLILLPSDRAPSVEQMIVAEAQAAAEADALCVMPDRDEGRQAIAIPAGVDLTGDTPPLRMVLDPYPSFNGVAADPANDLVVFSDTNRKSLLLYDRAAGRR